MSAIKTAIEKVGGPSKAAGLLGCSVQAACFYRDGKRSFPVEFCARLSAASGVPRWDMRPVDWHVIWPELVGTEGAPALAGEVLEIAHGLVSSCGVIGPASHTCEGMQ
jgi:DNA-binding transcriptional regulator YdaS (Cro superfamily)